MRLENVFLGELENETFSKSYSHYKLKCLVWSQKTVLRHLNFLHILSICRDLDRAFRVIADLQAGSCWINNYHVTPAGFPSVATKCQVLVVNWAKILLSITRKSSQFMWRCGVAVLYDSFPRQ